MPLRVVSDDAIPFISDQFGPYADISLIPGHKINLSSIKQADAVLVRSITTIDAALLEGSTVKFIGSATAGTDHVDVDYLDSAGIRFAAATGGNANSVIEYVFAALFELAVHAKESLLDKTIGIVGCGSIGAQLAARLRALDITCLLCDPPLQIQSARREEQNEFHDLSTILKQCDVISLHVPLVREGPNPTIGLLQTPELSCMVPDSWLINTSRGGVVDEADLLDSLGRGPVLHTVTDVWNGEPNTDADLVSSSFIATPHIAGYSIDAKRKSTEIILEEFCSYFSVKRRLHGSDVAQVENRIQTPEVDPNSNMTLYLNQILRQMYDIREDDKRMRAVPARPMAEREAAFVKLRKTYPHRYGFERFQLSDDRILPSTAGMLNEALRIRVV